MKLTYNFSSAVFLSDVHLDDPKSSRAKAFVTLIDQMSASREFETLILLGDIFDFWMGNRMDLRLKWSSVIKSLERFRSTGRHILFFEGNHDIHLTPFWGKLMGFNVCMGPALLKIGSRTLWVEHGDQMDPTDRGYLFLRWLLRTRFVKWLGDILPERLINLIALRLSQWSANKTRSALSAEKIKEKVVKHIKQIASRSYFDLHVSGHVHCAMTDRIALDLDANPREISFVNLGSWLDQGLILKIRANGEWTIHPVPISL